MSSVCLERLIVCNQRSGLSSLSTVLGSQGWSSSWRHSVQHLETASSLLSKSYTMLRTMHKFADKSKRQVALQAGQWCAFDAIHGLETCTRLHCRDRVPNADNCSTASQRESSLHSCLSCQAAACCAALSYSLVILTLLRADPI